MRQDIRWQKKIIYSNILIVFFFIADRVLKILALKGHLFVFKNSYIAFSLPLSGLFFYIFLGIVLIFVISHLITYYQEKKIILVFCLSLILSGALSNILDRIFYGAVIDYIDTSFLFAFNIADAIIMTGVIMWSILYITSIYKKQKLD